MYQSRFAPSAMRPAFDEPGMPVGGVIGHEIENDLDVQGVRPLHQRVELGEGPEAEIDVAIVRNVIAEIRHR